MGEVPAREVLWNITGHWLIYPCFIAALAVAVVFFVRRWRLWKIGEPENRSDRRGERLRGAVRDALLQVKVAERRGPGLVHVAMYVAMIILLIATATVAAQADLGLPLVQGDFYLYFLSLTVDIAGAAFCIAMVACIVRRIANRALDTKPGDIVVLGLLLAIGVTGFVLEGLRIAGTVVVPHGARLRAHRLLDLFQARSRAARTGRRLLARSETQRRAALHRHGGRGPALLRLRPLGGAHVEGSVRHPGLRALQPLPGPLPGLCHGQAPKPQVFHPGFGRRARAAGAHNLPLAEGGGPGEERSGRRRGWEGVEGGSRAAGVRGAP